MDPKTPSKCPECGMALPPGSPRALCPRCALQGALDFGEPPSKAEPAGLFSKTGATLGDYELIEEISRGGMGVVYRARQRSLDRVVAVKMLLSGQHATDDQLRRFKAEAVAAAGLRHPNIVAVHEVGTHQGTPFFAMDLVDGPSLSRILRNGPLLAKQAAAYLKAIAEAIHFAHERSIIHRDLKPANILIDSNDQPRVTDFGLAKNLAADSSLTATGQVHGSPSYMPPEQASGNRSKVGVASDVYGLGAMLYHMLSGRPPFVGQTPAATLHQVETAEPIAPHLLNAGIPKDLETICLKCLEKDPARRYATASALAEELGRFLRDEPILARPTSRPEKLWRWARRNPLGASFIAVLAIGVFATTLLLLQLSRSEAKEKRRADAIRDGILASIEKLWPDPERQFEYISSEQLSAFLDEPKREVDYEAPWQRLTLGISVTESPLTQVIKHARPLQQIEDRMSEALGVRVLLDLKVFKYKNDKMAEAISGTAGKVNFASVGALSYVKAKSLQPGLIPVAREGITKPAAFFSRKGSGITNLNQVVGKRMAFGSSGATISLLAKVEMVQSNIFGTNLAWWSHWNSKSNYVAKLLKDGLRNAALGRSHSHAAAIEAVTNNLADVGVARREYVQDLTRHRLQIISGFESSPALWVATTNVAPDVVAAFRRALIEAQTIELIGGPDARQISKLVAVDDSFYDPVRRALTNEVRLFEGDHPVQSANPEELFEDDE